MTITQLVNRIKENNEDYEFYPTSPAMLEIIKKHLDKNDTILDIGAGDGNALNSLTAGKKYAIEKSQTLINAMPADIFIIGTDFYQSTLIDKKVDAVFCNPPYSEFTEWACKIIQEANAPFIFLILPERWGNNDEIKSILDGRKGTYTILAKMDFLDAPRKARAKVHIIKITLPHHFSGELHTAPFAEWIEREFPTPERFNPGISSKTIHQKAQSAIVEGRSLVPVLVQLYNDEMNSLYNNFRTISSLDESIFSELKLDFQSIKEFLQSRISGLKDKYWKEVFDHFTPITSRLTHDSREHLINTLTYNTAVDFTEENIYAVTCWAIKNANKYFDKQLINTYMKLVNHSNVIQYKSNKRLWTEDDWRYLDDKKAKAHYGLDLKCVTYQYSTFPTGWATYDYPNNLHNRVNHFINDLLTIASNLGFNHSENSFNHEWEPGKPQEFYQSNGSVLLKIKAFKNGNIHIWFNQSFIRAVNVEFGRLKGWLHSADHAADELNIPAATAKKYFKSNFILEANGVKLLFA